MVHTRQMLNKKIREDLQLHKSEVDAVIGTVIHYINDLPLNDKLVLRGLGTFTRKHILIPNNVNPRTGEPMPMINYTTVKFKSSKSLRK